MSRRKAKSKQAASALPDFLVTKRHKTAKVPQK
jgi:hypothetical protein